MNCSSIFVGILNLVAVGVMVGFLGIWGGWPTPLWAGVTMYIWTHLPCRPGILFFAMYLGCYLSNQTYLLAANHGAACIAFHCSHLYITTLGLSAILPKHGCHFKQLLIKAKILNILIHCYYLLVRRSSMYLLELKIPPFQPQTTF